MFSPFELTHYKPLTMKNLIKCEGSFFIYCWHKNALVDYNSRMHLFRGTWVENVWHTKTKTSSRNTCLTHSLTYNGPLVGCQPSRISHRSLAPSDVFNHCLCHFLNPRRNILLEKCLYELCKDNKEAITDFVIASKFINDMYGIRQ